MRNLMRRYYRSWIVPYAEGTLDARRRAQLEEQLARDPRLADELHKQRSVAERLQAHRPEVSSDADTARAALWPGIEHRLQPRRASIRLLVWAGAGLAGIVVWGTLSIPHGPAATSSPLHTTPIIREAQNLEQQTAPAPRRHHRSRVYLHPFLRLQPAHTAEADREPVLASRPGEQNGADSPAKGEPGQSDSLIAQDAAENSKTTVRSAEEQEGAARFHLATGVTSNATHEDGVAAEDAPPPDTTEQSDAPTKSVPSGDAASDTNAVAPVRHRGAHGHRHSRRPHPAPSITIE